MCRLVELKNHVSSKITAILLCFTEPNAFVWKRSNNSIKMTKITISIDKLNLSAARTVYDGLSRKTSDQATRVIPEWISQ